MTEAAKIAADLKKDGQAMTLTRVGAGTYDPVTGTTTGGATQTWTVYGITKSYRDGDRNAANSLILGGDKKAVVSAMGESSPGVWVTIEPKPGDALTVMGKVWTIIAPDELSPQGEALLYTCQVRR